MFNLYPSHLRTTKQSRPGSSSSPPTNLSSFGTVRESLTLWFVYLVNDRTNKTLTVSLFSLNLSFFSWQNLFYKICYNFLLKSVFKWFGKNLRPITQNNYQILRKNRPILDLNGPFNSGFDHKSLYQINNQIKKKGLFQAKSVRF